MNIIKIAMAAVFLGIAITSVYSDTKSGIISNRLIALGVLLAIFLDLIAYIFSLRDVLQVFLINFGIVTVLSLLLFFTHSFAGGDSKLAIVFALLYPADCCFLIGKFPYTLVAAICLAIFWGYIYLLVSALVSIFNGKFMITREYVIRYLKSYILQIFLITLLYISLLNLVIVGVNRYIVKVPSTVTLVLCLLLSFLIGQIDILKKRPVWSAALVITVILTIVFRVFPLSINPVNYIFSFLLILCQMTIRPTLYQTININELHQGMILSTLTSLMMQNSRMQGLPSISKEDLGSRLTEEEVNCVQEWAQNRNIETVSIVKKIPFAIFLVLGYLSYFLVWCILR